MSRGSAQVASKFPKFQRVEIFGHSGAQPYGLSDTFKGWTTRFCNMVGADEVNRAIFGAYFVSDEKVAGTSGNGGWGRVFEYINARLGGPNGEVDLSFLPQRDMGIFMFGNIDIGQVGMANTLPSDGMTVFRNTLRTCISRFRCARIWEDDDFATGSITTTNGSTSLTGVTTTTGTWTNGMYITGTGIQSDTYIVSGAGTATMVISKAANATGTVTGTGGTVSYSGTWTPSSAATDGSRGSSGTTARFAGADTNSFTIRVPPAFEGGTVVVGFFQDASRNSAQWAVTVDGGAIAGTNPQGAGPFDFRDANAREYPSTVAAPTNPKRSPACIRITNLAAGAHTIVVTANAHSGTNPAWFDWWGIEAQVPPLVCVMGAARMPIYPTAPYTFGDSDITTFNTIQKSVVAEFQTTDRFVFFFETDGLLNKNTNYFLENNTHPNEEGNALLARELVKHVSAIFPDLGTDQRARAGGFSYVSLTPNDKDRNRMRAGDYTQPSLIFQNVLGQDEAHSLAGGATAPGNIWEHRSATGDVVLAALDRRGSVKPAGLTETRRGVTLWAAPLASVAPGINIIRYALIEVPYTTLVTGIAYSCGATANGNDIVAMYNAAGTTRLGMSASAAQPTAQNSAQRAFTAAVTVSPGVYIIGVWLSSATGTWNGARANSPTGTATPGAGGPATTVTAAAFSATNVVPAMNIY